MIMALALALILLGLTAIGFGWRHRRPALLLLGAAVLVSHGVPLTFFDPSMSSATMTAYRADAVLMAALASMAWCLGYWLFARSDTDVAVARIPALSADPWPWHGVGLVCLVSLIGLAPGGPVGFAQSGFLRLPVETPLFSLTYACACFSALTTSLVCLRQIGRNGPAPWFSIGLVLTIFWVLGGRTQLVMTGLSLALLYLAHERIRLRRLILPGLVLALLAMQTLSFRLTLQGEDTGLIAGLPMTLSQISLLEGYALSARHVAEIGLSPGHYWDVLQQILPRALFPEKPLQLSRALRLMEARDLLGGLTPGLAGEAFAAGGQLWVCVMGLMFGSVLALLDNAYARLRTLDDLPQALTTALIPLLAIFALRGGFDTAIFRLAVLLSGCGLLALARPTHPNLAGAPR